MRAIIRSSLIKMKTVLGYTQAQLYLFFFVSLFIGFLLIRGVNAGQLPTEFPAPVARDPNINAKYDPTTLLIKFKPSYRSKVNDGNADNSGIASINKTFDESNVTAFDQVAEPSSKSNKKADIFAWYKVQINNGQPKPVLDPDKKTQYPELDNLEADLKSNPAIESVSKNYDVKLTDTIPNDPYYSSYGSWGQSYDDLWGLKKINAAKAWDITTGSNSVKVGVIDTGVDRTQPDLTSNIWSNPNDPSDGIDNDGNGYIDDTYGWNFCSNNNNSQDDNGHGTHVAGTIGATTNNNLGVSGVAWNVSIMPVKFLCSNGSGSLSSGIQALQYAADMGAKVTSNSWGCGCISQATEDAINYELNKGTTPIVAAGNSADYTTNNDPAATDGAIAVGATDSNDNIAGFSNTGFKNDINAPGVGILSLRSSNATSTCNTAPYVVATNYCQLNGTSMATPHVSGTAALMLSANPNLNTEQIRQILHTTAEDLGDPGVDQVYSYGRLDTQKAVQASANPTVLTPKITYPLSRSSLSGMVDINGTANGSNFDMYVVEVGYNSKNPQIWTTIKTSAVPVSNGKLTTFDTTSVPDGTYQIRVTAYDTTLPSNSYEYRIHDVVVRNYYSNIDIPQRIISKGQVKILGRAYVTGGLNFDHYTLEYRVNNGATLTSGITLKDGGLLPKTNRFSELGTIDTSAWPDDASFAIVLRVYDSTGNQAFSATGGAVDKNLVNGWPKFTPGDTCINFCWGNNIAMGDLDGDGQKEIIVPGDSNQVHALKKDGTEISGFPVTLGASDDHFSIFANPVIADLDGDLLNEIIVTATEQNGQYKKTYVINSKGQVLAGWPKTKLSSATTEDMSPSIYDLNGDNIKELVTYSKDNYLHAYEPDGTELAGFPKSIPSTWRYIPVTIFDIDNDGSPEIIMPSYNVVYVFDNQGNMKPGWPQYIPYSNGYRQEVDTPIAIASLGGDGTYQLVFYSIYDLTPTQTTVRAYNADGSVRSGFPVMMSNTSWLPVNAYLQTDAIPLSVADIDKDGKDELILPGLGVNGAKTGPGTTIINDGGVVENTPYNETYSPISLADIKGDGGAQFSTSCYTCQGQTPNSKLTYSNKDATYYWLSEVENTNYLLPGATQVISSDLDKNNKQDYARTYRGYDQIGTYDIALGNYTYLWESQDISNPKDNWSMFAHDAQHTSRFQVGQKGADSTAPQVVVASPSRNSSVSGTVSISANAIDDENVSKVDFYVDGTFVGTDNSWPYSTNWDTNGLNAGVQHALTAKAYDSSNNSATSAVVSVSVADTTAPNVPGNLRKTASTSTTITAAWDTPSDDIGVTGYKIYKNGIYVANTGSNNYQLTGLAPQTQYSISVEAFDAADNISTKATTNMTSAPDSTPPNAPTGLNASNITDISLTLGWNVPSDDVGVTSYQIYKNGTLLGSGNTNNFNVTGLLPLTSYNFTVKALDAAGNVSAASSPGSFTTLADTTKPSIATNLQIINVTSSSQRLTWTAATDNVSVSSYDIYRNSQLVGNSTGTFFDNSSLSSGTVYTYKIVAIDGAGNRSDDSASVFASTLATQSASPAKKTGDVNGDGKVNVFDLSLLLSKFKSSYSSADFNNDGKVDIFDLSALLSNYGR